VSRGASFNREPSVYKYEVFIVCCHRCKTFETLYVRLTKNGVPKIEESSHYRTDKDGNIVHMCNSLCTFTGARFMEEFRVAEKSFAFAL